MKKIEKIAGIVILISSVVILAMYFLPAFKAPAFNDGVLPSMIVFGRNFNTTMSGDGSAIAFKIFSYSPLLITYFYQLYQLVPFGLFNS